ncbi:hypothetical protein Syun_014328 [Stephania yunnanensis]|uniref:Uncharacterized protein n=1 Tax=Stephania yunnanensis TaxID=152371 RepID=A0AAP0JJ45_9MAGN
MIKRLPIKYAYLGYIVVVMMPDLGKVELPYCLRPVKEQTLDQVTNFKSEEGFCHCTLSCFGQRKYSGIDIPSWSHEHAYNGRSLIFGSNLAVNYEMNMIITKTTSENNITLTSLCWLVFFTKAYHEESDDYDANARGSGVGKDSALTERRGTAALTERRGSAALTESERGREKYATGSEVVTNLLLGLPARPLQPPSQKGRKTNMELGLRLGAQLNQIKGKL